MYTVDELNRTVYLWTEADIAYYVANGYKVVRVYQPINEDILETILYPRVA